MPWMKKLGMKTLGMKNPGDEKPRMKVQGMKCHAPIYLQHLGMDRLKNYYLVHTSS